MPFKYFFTFDIARATFKFFAFFPPKASDRNFLAGKALQFLRQAPNNTTAYNYGTTRQLDRAENP